MGKKKAGRSDRKNQQVFDKLGKIMYQEVSNTALVHSLMGLFKIELSAETPVVFAATESVRERDGRLEKQVSDFVLLAGEREFELEFQIADDKNIGSRMFGYGYAQGERHKPTVAGNGAETTFDFPEAIVIYLEPTPTTPNLIQINIRQRGTVISVYEARVYKVLEHSLEEMAVDKLYILLPFYLLKCRRELTEGKSGAERRQELARETAAIAEEIEGILERGVYGGLITGQDLAVLTEKTYFLYRELYGTIPEFKEGLMQFEEKFRSKILEREAQWQAEKEAAVRQTAQQERAKILHLFRQGYTPEQVEQMLSQEGDFQPAMT